jgi:hypothetical protein
LDACFCQCVRRVGNKRPWIDVVSPCLSMNGQDVKKYWPGSEDDALRLLALRLPK